ncbi:MAG: alpha/beta family hydrolase, partial [Ardenticatenaceae bacterium]
MFNSQPLDIAGYRNAPVPNTFLPQDKVTRHLALVFPGMGYTAQMPVLYYPSRLLLARGADVLLVEYDYQRPEFATVPEAERGQWLYADVEAAYQAALAQRDYRQITLVGKSLGTLALAHLLPMAAEAGQLRCIWLTPLLHHPSLQQQIRKVPHRALFIIGTADPLYNATALAQMEAATQGSSVVIESADHSLEIRDDILGAIHAQARIIEALD